MLDRILLLSQVAPPPAAQEAVEGVSASARGAGACGVEAAEPAAVQPEVLSIADQVQ